MSCTQPLNPFCTCAYCILNSLDRSAYNITPFVKTDAGKQDQSYCSTCKTHRQYPQGCVCDINYDAGFSSAQEIMNKKESEITISEEKIEDLKNRIFDLERELSSIKANQEEILAILQILKDR